jgi:hypothetical protein
LPPLATTNCLRCVPAWVKKSFKHKMSTRDRSRHNCNCKHVHTKKIKIMKNSKNRSYSILLT